MSVIYRSAGTQLTNDEIDSNFKTVENRYEAASIASATLMALTNEYNYFTVSGNTDIGDGALAGFNFVSVGFTARITFDSAGGALRHHATNFILPGGADITWAAGDTCVFVNESSNTWRCVEYTRAANAPNDGLTAARVPFVDTDGNLTDDADMTFAVDTLTVDKIVGTTSITGDLTGNVTGNLTGNVVGNVTGDLTGNADTVTTANEAIDTTCFPNFTTAASGSLSLKTNTGLTFDSSSEILTATGITTFLISSTASNQNVLDGDTSVANTTYVDRAAKSVMSGNVLSVLAGTTRYGSFANIGSSATEAIIQTPCPTGGRILAFYTYIPAGQNTYTQISTITLRIDGVDTALATSYAASGDGVQSDTGTVSITAGQLLSVECDCSTAGSGSLNNMSFTILFTGA